MIAENLLLKQQLQIIARSRRRAPNLVAADRLFLGFWSLFLRPGRIRKSAVILRPSTLLRFHQYLVRRKYRLLFSRIDPDRCWDALTIVDLLPPGIDLLGSVTLEIGNHRGTMIAQAVCKTGHDTADRNPDLFDRRFEHDERMVLGMCRAVETMQIQNRASMT